MPRALNVRRSIALTSAVVLTAGGGALLAPASADPGSGHGNANGRGNGHQHGNSHQAPGQQKDKQKDKGRDKSSHGNGNAHPGSSTPGSSTSHGTDHTNGHSNGNANGNGNGNGNGDPAGNNGTVKIAPLGEMDSIPNNTPHPGCSFQVEWYGFDEGADVVSTVTFAMQAPTSDVDLAVSGPQTVFVGGDPASGAGTDSGLDGRETYTLSFTGEPHPQQGYHVRLTVATPRSQGNDTKTKVFWVEPCATDTGTEGTGTGTGTGTGDDDTGSSSQHGTTDADADMGVLGTQSVAPAAGDDASSASADSDRAADDTAVPTAVDAGEDGSGTLADLAGSPWPFALVGLGGLVTLGAVAARRRTGADVR